MPVKVKNKKNFNKDTKNNRKELKINKSKIILLIILIITILFGILVGISYSKYQSKLRGQAFVNIAKPVLEVRKQQSLHLTALAPKASYVFEVRNYKEEELNQVEMEYYIEIISKTDEAIDFALYSEDQKIFLNNNKTQKIKLTKDEKEIHSYRLEITYDKLKGTLEKDISENVEVKIHSIQKV